MNEPIRDGHGRELPEHHCSPRSEMAEKCARVVRLYEGPWQFSLPGATISVAIEFCPFCGVKLGKRKGS